MTKIIDIQLPKNKLGNDPHDFRHHPELIPTKPASVLEKMDSWILTPEQEARAKEGFWLFKPVVYHNHACLIVGPANSGKTRIAFYICEQIAADGYDIRYINMDINLADAVRMKHRAQRAGFKFLTPDLDGVPSKEVFEYLKEVASSDEDLSKVVFVIDNLKQIADVIAKHDIKSKMQLLCRTLTGTGATIVILSHTNKHADKDGKPVFEGTNDVRDLATEMFYLVSDKHGKGRTVELVCDKQRIAGSIDPISFEIDLNGDVTESLSPVDVRKRKKDRDQIKKDSDGISAARDKLAKGPCMQKNLQQHVHEESGVGKGAALQLIKRYAGRPMFWTEETGENNCKIYKKW